MRDLDVGFWLMLVNLILVVLVDDLYTLSDKYTDDKMVLSYCAMLLELKSVEELKVAVFTYNPSMLHMVKLAIFGLFSSGLLSNSHVVNKLVS